MRRLALAPMILFAIAAVGCEGEHQPVKPMPPAGGGASQFAAGGAVTYDQVQPIFNRRCSACHLPGGQPNWMSYDVAFGKKDKILDRITARTMPPAGSPQSTQITDEERATIAAWVKAGAPKGGGASPPPAPTPEPVPPAPSVPCQGNAVSYAKIFPILQNRCKGCHDGANPGLPNWLDYDVAYLKRGNILNRAFVKRDMPMPPYNTQITEDERGMIADWVKAGACRGDEPLPTPAPTPAPSPTPTPRPTPPPGPCNEKLSPDLISAVATGDAGAVDKLLSQGACPNAKDDKARPVILAAIVDQSKAGDGADYNKVVASLAWAGAEVNVAYHGASALLWAEYFDFNDVAQALAEKGADLNAQVAQDADPMLKSSAGFTAVMFAVQNVEIDAVDFLLASGANPALKSASGETAASLAEKIDDPVKKPIVTALLEAYNTLGGRLRLSSLTYTKNILPVLQQRCAMCHNAATPKLNWLDYETAFRKKALIYVRAVVLKDMPMNDNATKMTDEERALLDRWIQAGSPK